MPDNLGPGSFAIVSISERNLLVGPRIQEPPIQNVIAGGPPQEWTFNKGSDGNYLLTCQQFISTGTDGNNVIVSIIPGQQVSWKITYQQFQDAYTIARADNPSLGWTVSRDTQEIQTKPIIIGISDPPYFAPNQLFKFTNFNS